MGSSWVFVGSFSARGDSLKKLQAALPAQQSAAEDIRDSNVIHDRIYSTTGLVIARLGDSSEYAELLADVRASLAKVAKAGASGTGDLVGFTDNAATTGIHFDVDHGKVVEKKISTAGAIAAVRKSKAYRALVARHAQAFDDEADDESGNDVVHVAVRDAIFARLAKLSDTELLAAAKKTGIKIDKGAKSVPLHELYAKPATLRKALEKGGKEWCDAINNAPLAIVAVVDAKAALEFARRIIDEKQDKFDPLKQSAITVLGASEVDEDFERVWRVFDAERCEYGNLSFPAGTDELLVSDHPRVEPKLFAAFRDELGEPPAYRMPWENERSGRLAWLLYRRGHPEAVKLIEEASRLHPWKHFFAFDPKLLGNRGD